MEQIAFLGTGLLGSAFVEAALKRGDDVTVWNRTGSKAKSLETFGARAAATPADAVRGAARVHLVLTDDAVVDAVIAAMRPGLGAAATIVDHSTTQPALTAARSKRLSTEGVRYLHCPVFIGPAAARQSKGSILVSGPKSLFAEVEPALRKMAERVDYLGERPDTAAVLKLCGNAVWIGMTALTADVLAIAKSAGVDASEALRVADFMSQPGLMGRQGERMATDVDTPAFELAMARKDVRLMQETAGSLPLSALEGIAERMDAIIAQGEGAKDLSIMGRARGTPTGSAPFTRANPVSVSASASLSLNRALTALAEVSEGEHDTVVRLERSDGSRVEGRFVSFDENALMLSDHITHALVTVAHGDCRALEVETARRGREWMLAVAAIIGATAVLTLYTQLPWVRPGEDGVVIGFIMLFLGAGSLLQVPFARTRLHRWLTAWRPLYPPPST